MLETGTGTFSQKKGRVRFQTLPLLLAIRGGLALFFS
jgi:hypothetical protein